MSKPEKPYPEFPLFAHASGQWAKKIRGKMHYFGVWADWQAALKRYNEEHQFLYAGQAPPTEVTTVADVLNQFLGTKNRAKEDGEITRRTYAEYDAVCDVIAEMLGTERPVELVSFEGLDKLRSALGKGRRGQSLSPVTQKRLINMARMVFYFANEELG